MAESESENERALVQQPRLFACARCQLQCFPFDAHLCFTGLIWLKVIVCQKNNVVTW